MPAWAIISLVVIAVILLWVIAGMVEGYRQARDREEGKPPTK